MKILMIGQLPKELGANYTTGVGNVIYELSKYSINSMQIYTFATNIKNRIAVKNSCYPYQYIGYKITFVKSLFYILTHPIMSYNEFLHYIRIDHANPFRYWFYKENIKRAIKITNPDIIHVHNINNLSAVHFALKQNKIPILLTCHGIFYRGDKQDVINRDRNLGNIKLADAYSGLTKESPIEYESILGIPKEKVTVIPNGVDCKKFFFSPKDRETIRKEFEVTDDCIVFITVASIQERKGQYDFIKQLKNININYQYWIIGKGPDEIIIEEFIKKNNLKNKIKMFGYMNSEDLYRYYSAADIYVHASWKEGQALSELEANATGLRTIVNKSIVGTIASNINPENYFVLDFDNFDSKSFEKWISKMPQNRSSKTTYDWSSIATQYFSLYKKIKNNYNI